MDISPPSTTSKEDHPTDISSAQATPRFGPEMVLRAEKPQASHKNTVFLPKKIRENPYAYFFNRIKPIRKIVGNFYDFYKFNK